jgi:AraC-like DNA-binding protein
MGVGMQLVFSRVIKINLMLIAKRSTYLPRKVITDSTSFEIRRLEQDGLADNDADMNGCISSHYEIIWVLKGEGRCWLNLEKREISDGSILCIKPDQCHKLEAEGMLQGFVISFNESFLGIGDQEIEPGYRSALARLFDRGQAAASNRVQSTDMQEVAEKLLFEFNNADLFRTEILQRYLKVFLVYLARQFEHGRTAQAPPKRTSDLVERFFSLLNKDFGVKKMVADYARQLFVTPNYLNETVKKTTGHPAGYHIRQRIVLEAKRMVTYAGVNTKEVAYALGFTDMAHFSRFFKQNAGLNFSDFKRATYMSMENSLTAALHHSSS